MDIWAGEAGERLYLFDLSFVDDECLFRVLSYQGGTDEGKKKVEEMERTIPVLSVPFQGRFKKYIIT